ncbi:hypothetical protein COBT_002864 [Conglomerata obtusa]
MIFYHEEFDIKPIHVLSYSTYLNDTDCAIPESQKLQEEITHLFFNNLEYLLITDYSDFYIKVALMSEKSINLAITSILPNNHGYLTFIQSENCLLNFSYIHDRQYTRNGVTLEKIQFDIDSLFIFEYALFKYQNVHYNINLDGKSRHIDPTCIEHFFFSVNNVKYEKVNNAKNSQPLYALDIYLLTMTIHKQKQRYFIFYSAFLHIYNIVNLDIEYAKYLQTFYYDYQNLNTINQFAYFYNKHMKIYTEVAMKYERHLKRILSLINLNFFVQGTAINHTLCMVYNKYARSYIKFYINLTYITIRYLDYLYISNNTQKILNLSKKFNLKYYLAISNINNTKFKEETNKYYQDIIKNFIGDDLESALYNFYDLNDQNKKKTIFDCSNLQIETDLFFSKTVIDMLLELENILLNFYEKMYLEYSKSIRNPQLIAGVISADEYHDNNFARSISEQTFLKYNDFNPAKKQKT